ncbi:MAG: type II toxin-antitoxin system RatA family toxin [Rhodospirillales bacterium]
MPSHREQKLLPYSPDQLFELVIDVEHYPEFLPWCLAARVTSREAQSVTADLVIGFKMVRERFTSKVSFDRQARLVETRNIQGPFRHLRSDWAFKQHDEGCLVDFSVDFEFRSRMLQRLIQPLFHEAVRRMVAAFEGRARALYGTADQRTRGAGRVGIISDGSS